MSRLQRTEAVLLIVDVQERLMPVISGREEVEKNIERLVRGCRVLDIPILLTEQYVKGLGPTFEPIRRALEETSGYEPIEKTCFSACGSGEFLAELRNLRRKQIILAGVETHVCVYQTAADLLGNGHEVSIIADAVGSRTSVNKYVSLIRMMNDGAKLSTTEMALFELVGNAGTDEFRAISRLVK